MFLLLLIVLLLKISLHSLLFLDLESAAGVSLLDYKLEQLVKETPNIINTVTNQKPPDAEDLSGY